jgi:hypothetical protein
LHPVSVVGVMVGGVAVVLGFMPWFQGDGRQKKLHATFDMDGILQKRFITTFWLSLHSKESGPNSFWTKPPWWMVSRADETKERGFH